MASDADDPGGGIEAAAQRLERAVALLEVQVRALAERAEGGEGGLFDHDRAKLAEELDVSRAREKELHAAGQEASVALGRAIAGIRNALERAEGF